MANDKLLVLDPGSTLTATATATALDLGAGPSPKTLWAQVRVTAVAGTAPTAAHKVQHSDDNTTFTDHTVGNPASVTAAAVVNVPITTPKRYVRLVTTIGGTTPSFTQDAYIGPAPAFPEG